MGILLFIIGYLAIGYIIALIFDIWVLDIDSSTEIEFYACMVLLWIIIFPIIVVGKLMIYIHKNVKSSILELISKLSKS